MIYGTFIRRSVATAVACLHLVVANGCGYIQSKKCCPVYLPNDHLLGNEAVRTGPCGPDGQFYGLKRTTWREWPAEWEQWQPSHCAVQPAELLPPAGLESAPVDVDHLRPIEPQHETAPAQNKGETDIPAEPRRRIDPLELFGPTKSDEGAKMEENRQEHDRLQPNIQQQTGLPVNLPQEEWQPGSVRPSSWSLVEADLQNGSRTSSNDSATTQGQLELPPSWPSDSPPVRQTNRRAPRPSKLLR